MRETERIVTQWVGGVPAWAGGPVTPGSAGKEGVGRTVVVDTDDWIPALVSSGVIDSGSALLHRGDSATATAAGWRRTYVGTFCASNADLIFADGFRLRQTPYGLADFSCLDTPTALVLVDEHDFSAFLRDADAAWRTGVFANHVTHPLAVLANAGALGAVSDLSGPDRRLFVTSNGSVSTSPFGSILGSAWDDPAIMAGRWEAAHRLETVDAVSLGAAVPGADRMDAMVERSWLPRYFEAAAVIRSIRAEHLQPGRVSGFGGRLADQARSVLTGPDGCGLPVLVEVGESVRAVDPSTGAATELTGRQVATAERLLGPPGNTPAGNTPSGNTPAGNTPAGNTPAGNTPAGNTPAGDTPAGPDIADLVRTLRNAALSTDWIDAGFASVGQTVAE